MGMIFFSIVHYSEDGYFTQIWHGNIQKMALGKQWYSLETAG